MPELLWLFLWPLAALVWLVEVVILRNIPTVNPL